MRVSILIPVRNGERFLGPALDSVASAADATEYEVLVQDGLSTDATRDIALRHPTNVLFESRADTGQADGLNRALARSSGDIIGWLNADDLYRPHSIARAAELFAADPALDIVYGDWNVIDERGDELRSFRPTAWDWKRLYMKGVYIFTGATFFRRAVFERFGDFDTGYDFIMDFEFYLRIGRSVTAVSSQMPFGTFRIHRQSKTGSQGFQFCKENARLRRKYLASRDANLADYARAQAIGWVGAATTSVRYSALYSRLRNRARPV